MKRPGSPLSAEVSKVGRADPAVPHAPDKVTKSLLLDLPEELLLRISDCAPKRDLKNLTRTCKDMRRIALPRLFHAVTINLNKGRGRGGFYLHATDCQHNRNIVQFIATNTRSLAFTVPGNDKPSILPLCAWILNELQAAKHLEELRFANAHFDQKTLAALEKLIETNSKIKRNLKLISFPHLNTEARFAKYLERSRLRNEGKDLGIGEFNIIEKECGMTLKTNRASKLNLSIFVPGARGHVQLPEKGLSLSHLKGFRYTDCRKHGWGSDLAAVRRILKLLDADGAPEHLLMTAMHMPYDPDTSHIGIESRLITTPAPVTSLQISHVCLQKSHFDGVCVLGLQKLTFISCPSHEVLFEMFKPHGVVPKLSELTIWNQTTPTQAVGKPYLAALGNFLQSFSGLTKLHLRYCHTPPVTTTDLHRLLQNHHSLEDLLLGFGDHDIGLTDIDTIHQNCPNLKALSIKWDAASNPIATGAADEVFTSDLQNFAAKICKFSKLEELEISMLPKGPRTPFKPDADGISDPIQRTARVIHQKLQITFQENNSTDVEAILPLGFLSLSSSASRAESDHTSYHSFERRYVYARNRYTSAE